MSRKPPSTQEVIEAIKGAMAGRGRAVEFEDLRYPVQLRLKTVARSAREWMLDALTDPAQNDVVLLHSHDTKFTCRVVRTPSGALSYYGELGEDISISTLYLDRHGNRVDAGADAIRNRNWIMDKSILDRYIAEIREQDANKQAERDKERAAESAEVEEIVGVELSMIRGMLITAGIEIDNRTLSAWAMHVKKDDGRTVRRARATVELPIKSMIKLAKWLQDQGVEPVGPEGKTS